MPQLFADAIRRALTTDHAALSLRSGSVAKYPADIAPFAVADLTDPDALATLHSLLHPGEATWVCATSAPVACPGLSYEAILPCLQMEFSAEAVLTDQNLEPTPLTCADAQAMLALTGLAFPGFFRPRTCEMGRYFGFRDGGELVAMGGERLNFTANGLRYREISGLCTHPGHRGRGYGTALLGHLLRLQRAAGEVSWLHVAAANTAQTLYEGAGFMTVGHVTLQRLRKDPEIPHWDRKESNPGARNLHRSVPCLP